MVDQDGGVDDALALMLLAREPLVKLHGVGAVHGNVDAYAAARNGIRALEFAGDHATPVAVGAAQPLAQPRHLSHPGDPLAAIAGKPERKPAGDGAVEQMLRLSHEHDGELCVLALGPLTNIALAVEADPGFARRVRRLVVMGGAYRVKGNVREYAEANIWHDPEAADVVLSAAFADRILVPLDVTRNATVTRMWLRWLAKDADRLRGRIAGRLLEFSVATGLPSRPLHDPLAAVILLDPSLATYHHRSMAVALRERRGTISSATDTGRPVTAVAVTADTSTLLQSLFRTLIRS
ncbi:nucleoside hydrolase [Prauserella marina]|uniref:nucleoside hydrolase n=1 Tax=Prauserella marina TaxID=530584 RepID=UPI0014727969|nr:nucleoside hydrolase [Prauserella marina]